MSVSLFVHILHAYICIYIYIYIYIYIDTHTYTHTHTSIYALIIARFRVQYHQNIPSFLYFADLFHEPLGE